jgi:DNA repair protein RadC
MILSEKKQKMNSPEKVAEILNATLKSFDDYEQEKEHFFVLGLNNKNTIQYLDLISIGTVSESIVHPREVFRLAILKNCSSIIIGHNHPSKDLTPSREDNAVTVRLKDASKILGIPLLDHLIVDGDDNYLSLKEKGMFFE